MEFYDFCLDGMLLCQMLQEIVHHEQLFGGVAGLDSGLMELDAASISTMPDASAASRPIDENPPHSFSGSSQKMPSTIPRLI